MATTKRSGKPEIWVTGLAGLLVGDQSCLLPAWLPAHYKIEKRKSDFDFAAWRVDHTRLLDRRVSELKADGWEVSIEDQNRFKLIGETAILVGKPDIVAWKGDTCRVEDAKTGKPSEKHEGQVSIYVIALPLVWQRPEVKISGRVVYGSSHRDVRLSTALGMRGALWELVRKIAAEDRPVAVPSEGQCKWCDISADDCPDRWTQGTGTEQTATTADF